MKFLPTLILIISLFSFSCKGKQVNKQGGPGTISPEKTLSINFYPPWGGSAEAILERKKGVDNLFSTYHQKVNGVDTMLTNQQGINTITADSIYALAEMVLWNDDANYGTAVPRVGLKFNMSFRKGRNEKSVSWENLLNVNELPIDIRNVIQAVNNISPAEFKLF